MVNVLLRPLFRIEYASYGSFQLWHNLRSENYASLTLENCCAGYKSHQNFCRVIPARHPSYIEKQRFLKLRIKPGALINNTGK